MSYKLTDFVSAYIDENFWLDFIEDTYNLDVVEYINSYYKNIKKAIKLLPVGSKIDKEDTNFWTKIYQYKKIDYSTPITYKYFKNIMLSSHGLINLIHLQIDLHQSLKTITKSCEFPLSQYFNIDAKTIFKDLILYRIDMGMDECTIEDAFVMINEHEQLKNSWINLENKYKNYWFWLWMFISLSDACCESLYKIKLASLNYRTNFINYFESDCNNQMIVNIEDEPKKYNMNTIKETEEWERCRKIFKIASDEYRLVKFIVNSAYNELSLEQTLKKLEALSLNEDLYISIKKAVSSLFPLQKDWFNIFKNYVFDNYHKMYQLLFYQHDFNSLKQIQNFFTTTKQRQAALDIVKFSIEAMQSKSDKTILNMISDMEYLIDKNKSRSCPMGNAKIITDKYLDKYTIVQNLIIQSSMAFSTYLNVPTESNLKNLNEKLTILNHSIKIIPN